VLAIVYQTGYQRSSRVCVRNACSSEESTTRDALLIPLGQLAPRGFESLSLRSKPQVSGLPSHYATRAEPTCPVGSNVIRTL
jgi:hypothetical protein